MSFQYKSFTVTAILTKPRAKALDDKTKPEDVDKVKSLLDPKYPNKVYLTKRNFHTFINSRPCELQPSLKTAFFDLYGNYVVGPHTLPYVLLHLETDDLSSFEQRITYDMRQVFPFASTKESLKKDKILFETIMRKNVERFFKQSVDEYEKTGKSVKHKPKGKKKEETS